MQLALFGLPALLAQTYRVPLGIRSAEIQGGSIGIEVESDSANQLHASIPGGGEMLIDRMPPPLAGVIVHIPGAEPPVIALLPDQRSQITYGRHSDKTKNLPYIVQYLKDADDGRD